MGIFDIFRSKQEEPEPEPVLDDTLHTVPHEDLNDWFREQFGSDMDAAEIRVEKMRSSIMKSVSDTRESLLRLQRAHIDSNEKMVTMANMTKDSYVKHSLSILGKLSIPKSGTHSELMKANKKVKATIKEINRMTPKQTVFMGKYFGRESSGVAGSLKALEDTNMKMKQFLESDARVTKTSEQLEINSKQLSTLIRQSQDFEREEDSIREKINNLDVSKKEAGKKLKDLIESNEWGKLKSSEEIIREGNKERDEIEMEANDIINTAKRPLKKLMHHQGGKSSFPESPFKEYVIGNNEMMFTRMLQDAKAGASSGEIILKPREKEKLDHVADYIGNDLPMIKKRYMLLKEASKNAESQVTQSQLHKEKTAIQEEIADIERKHKSQWSELDARIQERKRMKSEIQELKITTERLVQEHGKKLEIKI